MPIRTSSAAVAGFCCCSSCESPDCAWLPLRPGPAVFDPTFGGFSRRLRLGAGSPWLIVVGRDPSSFLSPGLSCCRPAFFVAGFDLSQASRSVWLIFVLRTAFIARRLARLTADFGRRRTPAFLLSLGLAFTVARLAARLLGSCRRRRSCRSLALSGLHLFGELGGILGDFALPLGQPAACRRRREVCPCSCRSLLISSVTRRICSFVLARSSFKLLSRSSVSNRSSNSARSLFDVVLAAERDGEPILAEHSTSLSSCMPINWCLLSATALRNKRGAFGIRRRGQLGHAQQHFLEALVLFGQLLLLASQVRGGAGSAATDGGAAFAGPGSSLRATRRGQCQQRRNDAPGGHNRQSAQMNGPSESSMRLIPNPPAGRALCASAAREPAPAEIFPS